MSKKITKMSVTLTLFAALFVMFMIASVSSHEGHAGHDDSASTYGFVRVADVNAAEKTYTLSCVTYPEFEEKAASSMRFWSVRVDAESQNEYESYHDGETFTYTFEEEEYYHIGCQIVYFEEENGQWVQKLHRGDLHLDLRNEPYNPEIVPLEARGSTVKLFCDYDGGPYSVSWDVINIAKGGIIEPLGNANPLVHTAQEAGLYDYRCFVNANGQVHDQYYPVEFFETGNPYLATENGIPTGVYHDWPENIDNIPDKPWIDGEDDPLTISNGQPSGVLPSGTTSTTMSVMTNENAQCKYSVNGGQSYNGMTSFTNTGGMIHSAQLTGLTDGQSYNRYVKCQDASGNVNLNDYVISFSVATEDGGSGGDNETGQCYASVENIPATCNGGTITIDNFDGCRHLTCEASGKSLKVLACEKPDSGVKQFFEMYKQSSVGSGLEICLGETCVSSSDGYDKSSNFPICLEGGGNGTGGGDPGEGEAPDAPTWLEPLPGTSDVHPGDFHIQVFPMTGGGGYNHIASDFEVWDVATNQKVWTNDHETVVPLHVHPADGVFVGAFAGKSQLNYNTDYKVRARFYTDVPTSNVGPWSEWSNFKTVEEPDVTPSGFIWDAMEGYTVDLVASGITMPVNIDMAPELYSHLPSNERPLLYVTQLYGQIGMVKKNGEFVQYATDLLNYDSFGAIPGAGETGVTGIYVDEVTGDLFVSMVYNTPQGLKGKVDRFITNMDGDGYTSVVNILSDIPVSPSHQVQDITRGPDGKLYLNTGDANNVGGSADPNTLSGKVLRFNDDGSIPADNPKPGSYVYASGFRNPFGAGWRPGANEMYVSENGPDEDDALKKITPGGFHGWCCDTSANAWKHYAETSVPTQIDFNAGGNVFPANTVGYMYVTQAGPTYVAGGTTHGKRIVEYTFNADGSMKTEKDLIRYTGEGYGAPIGLVFGNDGLYFTDLYGEDGFVGVGESKGNIFRVRPGVQTGPPIDVSNEFSAVIAPAPWFPQGLNMVWYCNANGGSGQFKYDFHFGDGNHQYGVSNDNVYYTYPANGTYEAYCTVHDLANGESVNSPATTFVLGNGGQSSDTTPPAISGGQPSGVLPSGTTNAVMSVNTNENAQCKYSNNAGQNFASMTAFSTSGGMAHSAQLTGLTNGQSYTKYVKCEDGSGNVNANDYVISFSVASSGGGEPGGQCYASVENIPASCEGGTIISDTFDGCRHIQCEASGKSLHVLACNKPDTGSAQFFEMYKQSSTGNGLKVCLGETCVSSSDGYDKSDEFPICLDGDGGDNGDGGDDGNGGDGGSDPGVSEPHIVSVSVAPWYPQGTHVVLQCNAEGFSPDKYEWNFGDGDTQTTSSSDVYHIYSASGSYNVMCKASGEGKTAEDSFTVSV